ncbi:uncharacterized protein LOC123350191 isoform X3 [Mauremys mutica]|uniref:uncharacterized protein LOC123350191 isoform X3 n=1 Tax=Mauremys mutica TaxID=74926 RepID=UPI001D169E01|nr:uncharacterized protein LOC123350191 isoform X3 [Mauremys mutica]
MASTLTVLLLGCWLAGWSRVLGDPADSEDEFAAIGITLEYYYSDGSGDITRSEPSDPVTGAPEPSAAPGLTRNIIARVSAAAAGLVLLLLVAFLCYRRSPRLHPQSKPS